MPEYDTTVDLSVVICTYNRSDMLRDTLQSWIDVHKDACQVELIVVDNNSSDDSRNVVEQFAERFDGKFVYTFEANPGLSFARNKGIEVAKGKLIAFVDDDIYFHESWLKEIFKAFRNHSEADCIGGNSIPVFETPRPDWLADNLLQVFGSTRSGDSEKKMVFPEHPFGVNMAFKREVFDRIGMFNTCLGRIKKSLLSNEEKELFYRINQAGFNTIYIPAAIIHHRIPADRINQNWIIRRIFWQGISKVAFTQLVDRKSRFGLLKDILRSVKNAIIGPRPFSVKNCIIFYPLQNFRIRIKTALSIGIARQSIIELINFKMNGGIES